eukprot:9495135-Pyramimonas_sp.AAC.1
MGRGVRAGADRPAPTGTSSDPPLVDRMPSSENWCVSSVAISASLQAAVLANKPAPRIRGHASEDG